VESEPEVRLEYFELANRENLNLLENVSGSEKPIMCIAGFVGEVRLIDNMFLRD
jgi:pantoate--beta-alanine ligase